MKTNQESGDDTGRNTLETAVAGIRKVWGPLGTTMIEACTDRMADLARCGANEAWLQTLLRERPSSLELHRDTECGFVLLAHTEPEGQYRPPHDHGRGWVIYAVHSGEVEMRTYAAVVGTDGGVRLVRREARGVRPGEALVYLPGDIHDTRCLGGPALLFRLTERDLKQEEAGGHRVTRYGEPEGEWTREARCNRR